MSDLRNVLRSETAEAHERLDKELDSYDLTDHLSLSKYLCVHYLARSELSNLITVGKNRISNEQKIADIVKDLKVLAVNPPAILKFENRRPYHPLGLTYVMAGSSLGSKILYKRWNSGSNDAVKNAGRFLTSSKDSTEWKAFLVSIADLNIPPQEVEHIVTSANAVFMIYKTANDHVKGELR